MEAGKQQTYLIPLLNRRALVILGGWALAMIVASWQTADPADGITENHEMNFALRCFIIGGWLGGIAASCWITSAVNQAALRYGLQVALVLTGVTLFWITFSDDPWLSTLVDMVGIVLSQNVVFAWIAVPRWNDTRESSQRKPHQFSIGDLIAATTAFALLLTSARDLLPPIRAELYWPVLIGIWLTIPFATALLSQAMLLAASRGGLARVILVGIVVALGSFAMAIFATEFEFPVEWNDLFFLYVLYYLMVFVGFLSTFAVTSFAGRLASQQVAITESAEL
ncbi:membrane protein [Rhodopirellula maiorica SM1]|uniref:Membrane protein n=1 Tax=Rhodopirellula maiorica SM1 TaxID=1265738 RepID=M5RNK0_9BACT|nr:hypothetical protein [Rhodopirellula maiorica]EMI20870.1 membrane protein [Rhodopirellula maiorica SM1]